jgi:hypothetical protein
VHDDETSGRVREYGVEFGKWKSLNIVETVNAFAETMTLDRRFERINGNRNGRVFPSQGIQNVIESSYFLFFADG